MGGHLILTKVLRPDVVIKSILRLMKSVYKEEFYEHCDMIRTNYKVNAMLLELLSQFLIEKFPQ